MTDPERISRRGVGLAAELLRASGDEQPSDAGLQRTLAALGVSAAVVTATSAAGATLASGAATATGASATAGAGKAVTAALLVKWVGIGVVGGVGLAGAAALVTTPVTPPAPAAAVVRARPVVVASAAQAASPVLPAPARAVAPEPPAVVPAPAPRTSTPEPALAPMDLGAPLAAEVAFVDRARALLAGGQTQQSLLELARYEQEFPEPRLLPEVLFLQLTACDRLGRSSEARRAAQRLVEGFPRSPHAARARERLAHFP